MGQLADGTIEFYDIHVYTHTVQEDIKTSMALMYETGGRDACDLACCVERVSSEVTPNVTLAGAASGLIQNDTHFCMKNGNSKRQ